MGVLPRGTMTGVAGGCAWRAAEAGWLLAAGGRAGDAWRVAAGCVVEPGARLVVVRGWLAAGLRGWGWLWAAACDAVGGAARAAP